MCIDFLHEERSNPSLTHGENRMFGKNLVLEIFGPELGAGVGVGPFGTTFQTRISPERKEQIEIRLDFQKVERWIFQIIDCQISPISNPSPRKLGPKMGFEQF